MSFQTWVAIGNLTADPEMKYVGETPKCTFSIAINERRGEKEEVIFVDVECWDKLADTVAEYKRKGDAVLVQGRWKMDTWEDRESGGKRKKWYVRADQVRFIGSPRDDDREEQPRRRSSSRDDDRPRRSSSRRDEPRGRERDDREYDDLPF
jgi:single-strand DNA-binding protein